MGLSVISNTSPSSPITVSGNFPMYESKMDDKFKSIGTETSTCLCLNSNRAVSPMIVFALAGSETPGN